MNQDQDQTTTLPRLDEQALRRPGFRPGPGVTLADGQVWTVTVPRLAIVPVVSPGQATGIEYQTEFGPDFDRKILALPEAETFEEEARSLLGLAVDLLGANYDIPPARYREVLRYEPGNHEANRALARIYDIALGRPVGPESEVESALEPEATLVI